MKAQILLIYLWIAFITNSASSASTQSQYAEGFANSTKYWGQRRSQIKTIRLANLVKKIEEDIITPSSLIPESWSSPHNPKKNAVFAAAMATTLMRRDVQMFCGTLRKTGFDGDIGNNEFSNNFSIFYSFIS
jgi:hypothetical protein